MSSRIEYEKLRNDVWSEFYSLDKEGVVLHDCDIQQIAMIKAREREMHNFKVCKNKSTPTMALTKQFN